MKDLLIAATTQQAVADYLKNPSQALLLAGQSGSGRFEMAGRIARELLGKSELSEGASFKVIEPGDNGKISIDRIRELKDFSKLKSVSRRVVIVRDSDKMLVGAQNSFLKLLEEPPERTYFLLTGETNGLRPTVLSRLQQISVRLITLEQALEYFGDSSTTKTAYDASGGRVGLMSQLIDNSEHPLARAVEDAKQVLRAGRYERLCQVELLSKDRVRSLALVEMLEQMASSVISAKPDESVLRSWLRIERASLKAATAFAKNANAKLIMTDLMLGI